jgi:ABC-2 type transport system permease protein
MVVSTLRFLGYYLKVNWQGAMEFRASFITQIVSMMINNSVWIVFWSIFFAKFPVIKGWELKDILLLWGLTAGGFGWVNAIFGNTLRLSNMISTGQVDLYLTMPKNVLLHMLVSRMSFSAWGDYLFSWLIFFMAVGWDTSLFFKYLLAQFGVGLLLLAIFVLTQSLAFYMGNSEGIAGLMAEAMMTFSLYPIDIFNGFTRLALFVVLPAGFISSLPVVFFREIHWGFVGGWLTSTMVFTLLAVFVFYRGLRRYESGNMITLRM